MRTYHFLLILFLVLSTAGYGSDTRAYSSGYNSGDTPFPDTGDEKAGVTLNLPTQGRRGGTVELGETEKLTVDDISTGSKLSLVAEAARSDLLQYHSNFSRTWENGSGELSVAHNGSTTIWTDEVYYTPSHYEVPIDRALSSGAAIRINLSRLDFHLEEADFGYFETSFKFSAFQIHILHKASADYKNFYRNYVVNTSLHIYLLKENVEMLELDITEMSELANTTYPKSIDTIFFNVQKNEGYTFLAEFSLIALLQPVSQIPAAPFDVLDVPSTFDLQPNSEMNLSFYPDYYGTVRWWQWYDSWQQMDGEWQVLKGDLIFSSNSTVEKPPENFIHFFNASAFCTSFNSTGGGSNATHFWYDQAVANLYIEMRLIHSGEEISILSTALQGRSLPIESDYSHETLLSYAHHVGSDTWSEAPVSNGTVMVPIPEAWPKGPVEIISLYGDLTYSIEVINLDLSPAILDSSSIWKVNAYRDEVIPVILRNITSGNTVIPDTVETTINGNLRRGTGGGIEISAGELGSGDHVIEVSAFAEGLVPVSFEVTIRVEAPDFEPRTEVDRISRTEAILIFELPEFGNWTIDATLTVSGEGVNETVEVDGSRTLILVQNDGWETNEDYRINIFFRLGLGSASYNASIFVEAYDGEVAEPYSGLGIGLTAISLTGVIGMGAYRLYQSRYSERTISF